MQKGSIIQYRHKGGDVSFQVQYRDSSGKQVRETIGRKSEGWTKRKVGAQLAERISRVANKGYRKPTPVRFQEYADKWFEEAQGREAWRPNTIATYRCALKRLKARFGHMRLSEIRRSDVNAYSADALAGLAPRTVNLILTVLHSILEAAVLDELIDNNPASRARRPKEPDYKPRPLKPEEMRVVETKIKDPQLRLVFRTLALLGLRWSELRSLRWRDIDLLARKLRVEDSKTKDGIRSVAIPSALVPELEAHFQRTHYKGDSDFVFCHEDKGSRLNSEHYRKTVKAAVAAAGIKERFRPAHDLRVTSLTTGVLAGEHVSKIMARAGHTSYGTTKRYIELAGQVFHEDADAVAAILLGKPAEVAEES